MFLRVAEPLQSTVTPAPRHRPPAPPVCVLAKVGEASLKGRNRRHFLDTLRRNLKAALAGVDARVESGGSVLVIPVHDELVADEVASRLERVFGFATRVGLPALRARRRAHRGRRDGRVRARAAGDLRGARAAPRQVLPAHLAAARA